MCPLITFRTCSRNHTFTHRDMLKGWHRPHFPRTQRTWFCGGCFSSFSVFGRGVFKNKCHLEVVLASCPSSCIVFSFALYSSAMQYQLAQKTTKVPAVFSSWRAFGQGCGFTDLLFCCFYPLSLIFNGHFMQNLILLGCTVSVTPHKPFKSFY